jgi:hypothetical protein
MDMAALSLDMKKVVENCDVEILRITSRKVAVYLICGGSFNEICTKDVLVLCNFCLVLEQEKDKKYHKNFQ